MNNDVFAQAVCMVRDGRIPELEELLREEPTVLGFRDPGGDTLLGIACRAATGDLALPAVPGHPHHHAAVDAILSSGADPNAATTDGWSPLHTAAMTGNSRLIGRLLAAGAKQDGTLFGTEGGTPLSLALFYAQAANVSLLAHAPVPDSLRTAAALNNPLERFFDGEDLIPSASVGSDFYRPGFGFPDWTRTNTRQELLDEALSWAARNDACGAIEVLVAKGANVNSNAYRGTPLLWAIYADRVAAATKLLDHGANPNLRHDFGGQNHGVSAVALHLAAQYSSLKCLRLLLDRGADPTIKDGQFGGTPLGWAQHSGAVDSVELLSAAG